jgi:hypothetical protein
VVAGIAVFLALFNRPLMHGRDVEQVAAGGRDTFVVWATLLREYNENHAGAYPPLDPRPKVLMFDRAGVRPAYRLADYGPRPSNIAGVTPVALGDIGGNPVCLLNDFIEPDRFFYIGYAVTNDTEGVAFAEAYKKQTAAGGNFEGDLPVEPGHCTLCSDTLFRLNSHLAETLVARGVKFTSDDNIFNRIPVLMERTGRYPIAGCWVLYLNLEFRFVPYPGPFPMTQDFMRALNDIVRVEAKSAP